MKYKFVEVVIAVSNIFTAGNELSIELWVKYRIMQLNEVVCDMLPKYSKNAIKISYIPLSLFYFIFYEISSRSEFDSGSWRFSLRQLLLS